MLSQYSWGENCVITIKSNNVSSYWGFFFFLIFLWYFKYLNYYEITWFLWLCKHSSLTFYSLLTTCNWFLDICSFIWPETAQGVGARCVTGHLHSIVIVGAYGPLALGLSKCLVSLQRKVTRPSIHMKCMKVDSPTGFKCKPLCVLLKNSFSVFKCCTGKTTWLYHPF